MGHSGTHERQSCGTPMAFVWSGPPISTMSRNFEPLDHQLSALLQQLGKEAALLRTSYQKETSNLKADPVLAELRAALSTGTPVSPCKRCKLTPTGTTASAAAAGEASEQVCLNVGGENFDLSRGLFGTVPCSRFGRVFREGWDEDLPRDSSGRAFIDLNPAHFKVLIQWMEKLQSLVPEDPLPPHPAEALPLTMRWGFGHLCREFGVPLQNSPAMKGQVADLHLLSPDSRHVDPVLQCPESTTLDQESLEHLRYFLWRGGSLRLIFRASRDGSTAQDFHRCCDGVAPTVVVVRSKEGQVFGGYTDQPWLSPSGSSPHFQASQGTFLFRLGGFPGGVATRHQIWDAENALRCGHDLLPAFGARNDFRIFLEAPASSSAQSGQSTMKATMQLGYGFHQECQCTGVTPEIKWSSYVLADWEVFEVTSAKFAGVADVEMDLARSVREVSKLEPVQSGFIQSLKDFSSLVAGWQRDLASQKAQLQKAKERLLDEELPLLRHLSGCSPDAAGPEIVQLNVRGVKLQCFRSTLTQCPKSMLGIKFGDRWRLQEEDLVEGAVWIDHDPEMFTTVLDFLRLKSLGAGETQGLPFIPNAKREAFSNLLQYLAMEEYLSLPTFSSFILSAQDEAALLGLTKEALGPAFTKAQPELLFRASRDGFSASTFHRMCDNHGPTLVLIRSVHGYVLGGCGNNDGYSGSGHVSSKCFVFTLGVSPSDVPKVVSLHRPRMMDRWRPRIPSSAAWGPCFGTSDLAVHLDCCEAWTKLGDTFNTVGTGGTLHCLAESNRVAITELEVFAV